MEQPYVQAQVETGRDYSFIAGLLAGTVVGAGLAIWLAPKAAEAATRMTASAGRLRDDLKVKGDDLRDDLADAVVRGAHEVERIAVAAKSDSR